MKKTFKEKIEKLNGVDLICLKEELKVELNEIEREMLRRVRYCKE